MQTVPDAAADRTNCLNLLHDWLCAMLDNSAKFVAAEFTQVCPCGRDSYDDAWGPVFFGDEHLVCWWFGHEAEVSEAELQELKALPCGSMPVSAGNRSGPAACFCARS